MNFEMLIPISLFICIAYAIKSVVDARVRRQMVDSNGSQDLVRSILEGDELRRRHGSLRWGITLVVLALGFAAVEYCVKQTAFANISSPNNGDNR